MLGAQVINQVQSMAAAAEVFEFLEGEEQMAANQYLQIISEVKLSLSTLSSDIKERPDYYKDFCANVQARTEGCYRWSN